MTRIGEDAIDPEHKIGADAPSGQSSDAASLPSGVVSNMSIARDGTWYHDGGPIRRPALVKLFSTVLRRDEQGGFWLVTPVERVPISVEDAPFVAVELRIGGRGADQVVSFRTNIGDWVEAGACHPLRVEENPETGEPSPYILVRDRLEALILRPVFYRLVEAAEERRVDGKDRIGIWSKGTFFPLGEAT